MHLSCMICQKRTQRLYVYIFSAYAANARYYVNKQAFMAQQRPPWLMAQRAVAAADAAATAAAHYVQYKKPENTGLFVYIHSSYLDLLE